MKITKESKKLMSMFLYNDCVDTPLPNNETMKILEHLYVEINDGYEFIKKQKKRMGASFYHYETAHITNMRDIPKPITFPPNSFPASVRDHIDKNMLNVITYFFEIFDRKITILFLTEGTDYKRRISDYNNYVDHMLVWLYIVNRYSSKKCAPDLKIFIYHTNLLKQMPKTNIEILDESHVNTAFTRTCPTISEIVVFRKEEWFKVFIHETFHNFGMDFSDMDSTGVTKKMLSLFPVASEVNMFESYTEFWARIMNAVFCSYINTKKKGNIDEFLSHATMFINFERSYALFQMVKVLNFMDLDYTDLFSNTQHARQLRATMYKEKTSVLSYYVLTSILINNYQDFLEWCVDHNTNIFQFKKTKGSLNSLCKFIETKYKSAKFLEEIECTEQILKHVKHETPNVSNRDKQRDIQYLLTNLRMTMCELG